MCETFRTRHDVDCEVEHLVKFQFEFEWFVTRAKRVSLRVFKREFKYDIRVVFMRWLGRVTRGRGNSKGFCTLKLLKEALL